MISKALPPDLQKRFRQAVADPELLSLGQHVALLNTRLFQLLEELGKPHADIAGIRAAKVEFLRAMASKDQEALNAATSIMLREIDGTRDEGEHWLKIDAVVDSVRRLVDSIHKHQVQTAQILTLAQAQALFFGVSQLVRKGLVGLAAQATDERMKRAVQRTLQMIAEGLQHIATVQSAPIVADHQIAGSVQ